MQISIIIPVYNAAQYVTQAVESAQAQPETAEVILIEDGSPDGSLAVCQALADNHDKVRLLHHPNGENRGAGASRNLGMKNAQYEYIAFLDADDYYLPGRFNAAKKVIETYPDCEGIYEAIGIFFEDDQAQERWLQSSMAHVKMTTLKRIVPPDQLFETIVRGGAGYFHIDGLILKKTVLAKTGYMNEDLLLHQDSDFILRVSALARCYPGNITEPIAIRRVHRQNRVSAPRSELKVYHEKMSQWKSTHQYFKDNGYRKEKRLMVYPMLRHCIAHKPINSRWYQNTSKQLKSAISIMSFPLEYPNIIFERVYWFMLIRFTLSGVYRLFFPVGNN